MSNANTGYLRANQIRQRYGGISLVTLWRWVHTRDFPKPTKIAGRNYWPDDGSLERWEEQQAGK